MKLGKKEFRQCDFENEFTVEQGEIGRELFANYLDVFSDVINKSSKKLTDLQMMQFFSKIDNKTIIQIIALCHFEKTENGYDFIFDNYEENIKLFSKIPAKQLKEYKELIQSFFTFIMSYTTDAIQMLSAGIQATNQIQ